MDDPGRADLYDRTHPIPHLSPAALARRERIHDHEVPEGRHQKPRPQPDRYRGDVATQVIVLNGGSSSGKSGIARCLQAILPDPWLAFGTDNLVQAAPMSLQTSAAGIEFGKDGEVIVGPEFRTLEAAWIAGIAAMANAGARIIGMAASQAELVHRGIVYDLQVDTTHTEALPCAQAIAAHVQ